MFLNTKLLVVISIIVFVAIGCFMTNGETNNSKVVKQYRADVNALNKSVELLVKSIEENASQEILQTQFKQARVSYKNCEWLAEYYNAYTAKQINGPAIEEVEADEKTKVLPPEGFQVVEEYLFPVVDKENYKKLLSEAKVLLSNVGRLKYVASLLETTDAHIFDALRLQVFRIVTLGIPGFDSPIAKNSIDETKASLQAIEKYYSYYEDGLIIKDQLLAQDLKKAFKASYDYVETNNDFDSFDRMKFITDYLNPISKKLLLTQGQLQIPNFKEPRLLAAEAATLFEENIFNADFYSPGTAYYSTPEKVLLGKKLFYDGILSSDGKRSCATCHNPGKAFTDGMKTSISVTGKNILRNSPTLLNASLQPSLFYDTRVSFLEDQAKDVISNKDEMHGSIDKAVAFISNNKTYKKLFEEVYGNEAVSELQIKNAIASYVRSLISLNSRFDAYMRGNKAMMNKMEVDGFNLFMGKAKCGTCHFAPLFNGNNPPSFTKIDAEVIGVPSGSNKQKAVIDNDEGKYSLYKIEIHKNAFKTPTVRNIALTAPYMHNGVYNTLEEVLEFYNNGGGAGLGIELDNQTLPTEKLNLSSYETKAIIAFMKTLTDTSYENKPNKN